MGHHTAAVLNRDLALFVLKEDPVLIQLLDFAGNFPSWLISRMTFRWPVLRMICGSRLLPMVPPRVHPKLPKRLKWRNRLVGVALSQGPFTVTYRRCAVTIRPIDRLDERLRNSAARRSVASRLALAPSLKGPQPLCGFAATPQAYR